MRLLIARCQVDYAGRLSAHLPMATRLIMVKADGCVAIHTDSLAYKPLNWMSPPCTTTITPAAQADLELQRAHVETLLLGVSEQDLHDFVSKHYPHWGVKPLG